MSLTRGGSPKFFRNRDFILLQNYNILWYQQLFNFGDNSMDIGTKNIETWFTMIRDGLLTLPRFQRYEAWKQNQIENVIENILREPSLPIGALLTLEVGGQELFKSRPVFTAPNTPNIPKMNLLDGQQRITAIWRSLNDTYEDYTILVSLEDKEKPEVIAWKRSINRKTGTRLPAWVDNPADCFEKQFVPVKCLLPGSDGEKFAGSWIEQATSKNPERFRDLMAHLYSLRGRIAKFQIPFLSLSASTEKETALEVFINMNTSASPLKDFDIVVAQLEESTSRSLHDMIAELEDSVPVVRKFGKVEDMALSVGALLNNKPPLKKTYLEKTFGKELESVWDNVVKGISRGIEFLQSEMIFNDKLVPTEVITYLTSALWACLPDSGTDQEALARKVLRKTIWRASYTDRYLKTATTRAYADFKSLKKLLLNPKSEEQPPLFDNNLYALPTEDDLIRAVWPTRRDRLGRAILATSLRDGGLDFASDEKASAETVGKREYHHIYPRALLEGQFPAEQVNSALNCALISWKTNRKISAKSPAEYIAERAKFAEISKDQVKKRLESHLIPYDALINGDYQTFLDTRAKMIHNRMTRLAEGER